MKTTLVTGGAGFIGGCFVRDAVKAGDARIINLDALTYAGNRESIPPESDHHVFVQGSINDADLLDGLFNQYSPDAVVHFAAESHVDRSIDGPGAFIETNINGTYCLLTAARKHWQSLRRDTRQLSLPACFDRRSLRVARSRRVFYGNDALLSEFSLFGIESLV